MNFSDLEQQLSRCRERITSIDKPVICEGKVIRIVGLSIEAVGLKLSLGSACRIISSDNITETLCEVVGFDADKTYLMPIDATHGIIPGARVIPTGGMIETPIGDELLGRVLDGKGQPIDGKGPLQTQQTAALTKPAINPLERTRITTPLDVGIRSINTLLSVGSGQRIGLFAGSGVGKSVLLGMMTRYTEADVVVVALVGERGREVKEFIEDSLEHAGREKCVVVAAPADEPPLLRLHAALLATSVAEYFRDKGAKVLLLMDSLTRFAQAQRELSLAIGEPPTAKGYTPSVFSKLPQLVERAGAAGHKGGSITGFYTVLAEGDDQQDPVADCARAILDGHIVLTRQLADQGHYPAIDIEQSVSRVMPKVATQQHLDDAMQLKRYYSLYQQNKDLISVGAYTPGVDHELDVAVKLAPVITSFLQQGLQEQVTLQEAVTQLSALVQHIAQLKQQLNQQIATQVSQQ